MMKRTKFPKTEPLSIDHSLRIIHKIAHALSEKTMIDESDLFSEGCLAYCLMMQKNNYNPYKGKFSTYLYNYVKTSIIDYIRKHQQPKLVDVSEDIAQDTLNAMHVKKYKQTDNFKCYDFTCF